MRLEVPVSWVLDLSPQAFMIVVDELEEHDRQERIKAQREKMRARLGR